MRLHPTFARRTVALCLALCLSFPIGGCTVRPDPTGATDAPTGTASTSPTPTTATSTSPAAPVDAMAGGVLLGAPTDGGVLLHAMALVPGEFFATFGTSDDASAFRTAIVSRRAGEAVLLSLEGLPPDTECRYALMGRTSAEAEAVLLQSGGFHTARGTGGAFTFAIQADPHRDENSDVALYERTLGNILADGPDFLVDLGDTFMGEKLGRTEARTEQRYQEDRALFGLLSGRVPLFLVNGNHEGENGWLRTAGSPMPGWASAFRKAYFPCPTPGGFYAGARDGGNYYAFPWGDALFVMLDPFWFSEERAKGDDDGWAYTLGKEQYDWLAGTLAGSTAQFRFVFVHNLVGGIGKDARGGAEAAAFFEWGGLEADGTDGFAAHRPGWAMPIHELLVENRVTAVFHGHDHFYARQERDGIAYQLVPQPSHPGTDVRNASEYGYVAGEFLPPAGHIRVSVSSAGARVEYVGSSTKDADNASVRASYVLPPVG